MSRLSCHWLLLIAHTHDIFELTSLSFTRDEKFIFLAVTAAESTQGASQQVSKWWLFKPW